MNHTLSVLVENRAGVLARVAGMFSRRGYNIDSLAVGTTERKDISRMTIVVQGDDRVIEQVTKQLHKLVEVIKVSDITDEELVDRELVLIKVNCNIAQRAEIMQMVEVFRGKIVDIGKRSLTVEATGDKRNWTPLRKRCGLMASGKWCAPVRSLWYAAPKVT